MPRFAANLSWLFLEHPFLDRFAAAAGAGFAGVEFLFPYDFAPEAVRAAAAGAGVEIVLFNLPPGDWAAGERGLAALPGREAEFAASIGVARAYAAALGCPRLHVMAGIGGARATYISNLRRAVAGLPGLDVLVEPINRRDMPGYHLASFEDARALSARTGARVQADLYHMQIEGGDLTTRLTAGLTAGLADIGHVQVAGVPGRDEPDRGEIDCHRLFALLDELGYAGWVGAEYRPAGRTADGLGWLRRYL